MKAANKKTIKRVIYLTIKTLVLGLFLVMVIFPFWWMLMTSFKRQKDIFSIPLYYVPPVFSAENYRLLFTNMAFGRYLLNSVIVSLVAALAASCAAILGAYILARFRFRGKKAVMYYFLLTQMLPAFIGLAPLFQLLSAWNMIDYLPTLMILSAATLTPYSVITLRGFLQRVPRSLEESAMIDGCSRLHALVKVVLPVVLPGLAATYIFCFVHAWNDLFAPILYMNRAINYTIPVALNSMVMKNDVKWGELSAGTVISIVPTVTMFAFSQKYVAAGLLSGALKE